MSISKEKLDHYKDILQAIEDGDDIQERYYNGSWVDWEKNRSLLLNGKNIEYRRKPKPVEGWINIYPDGRLYRLHSTKEEAERIGRLQDVLRTVFVREVDPNE